MIKGLKVLVVDDEADARELVRRFLTECGAVAALAASAEEAYSLLPTFKPDVIISDIGMPAQDGYAFMRAVRVQGLKTPALALTAFARAEDRVRSIQAGFQMHLPKPVDPAELVTVIASLAGRFEVARRSAILTLRVRDGRQEFSTMSALSRGFWNRRPHLQTPGLLRHK